MARKAKKPNPRTVCWWLLFGGYDTRPELMAAAAASVGCTASTRLPDGERTLVLHHHPDCPQHVIASFYGVYCHLVIAEGNMANYRGDADTAATGPVLRLWQGYCINGDTWQLHPLSDC